MTSTTRRTVPVGRTVFVGRTVLVVLLLVLSAGSGAYAAGFSGGTADGASGTAADGATDSPVAEASGGAAAGSVAGAPSSALQDPSGDSNNSTVRHVDPEGIEGSGDLSGIESWLVREIGSRISQSSDRLEEGQYESAKKLLGDKYEERYSQYREIADQAPQESGASAESLGKLRKRQRAFLTAVQRYDRLYRRFQRAQENGSERRARRIARRLQRVELRVRERADSLTATYRKVSASTEMNLTESRRTTENVTANVTERQREIERKLFVPTELTATTPDESASFADPLVVRGRLRLANGTAIGNESVTFLVGSQVVTARTNDTGAFTFRYTPTNLSMDASNVTLYYLPDNQSVYQSSSATVPIDVSQTAAEIEFVKVPDEVGFGDLVRVRGRVLSVGNQSMVNQSAENQSGGSGVPNVPVVLTVGDERLGNATTGPNGTFEVTGELPATVPPGSVVQVSLPLENRTVKAANATANVSIVRTRTAMRTNSSRVENGTVRVVGRLTTEEGTPLANRSIQIQVDGRTLATVETGRTGVYRARVTVPESLRGQESVAVAATFDGVGTNLRGVRSTETVSLATDADQPSLVERAVEAVTSAPWWAYLLIGATIVPISYSLLRRFRGRSDEESASPVATPADRASDADRDDSGETPSVDLLRLASEQLADGRPEDATHTAYAAVRRDLRTRFDADGPLTHREFFARCRDAGLADGQLDALRRVLRAEERAQFASGGLPTDVAERAVEAGAALMGNDSTSDPTRAD